MIKRIFLLVMDSFGIGKAPDEDDFGDAGACTLASVESSGAFKGDTLARLGLFNIDGVVSDRRVSRPIGAYARVEEKSIGKDTTTGHFEIAGIISSVPFPTYPDGFPAEIIDRFTALTGRGCLCNKPYSGTDVIRDYGEEHLKTGKLIVYTSADSVFQIAAHESIVPPERLYEYCRIARGILVGKHAVGRVIARPFEGEYPFSRTDRRHDFSAPPPSATMLDLLSAHGYDTIGVGKIGDIFASVGVSESIRTHGNTDGTRVTSELLSRDFRGLCFVNLVDFDMNYGHRRDPDGYAEAVAEFDSWLPSFIDGMKPDDVLMITADHGCDPRFRGTDHTRECVPLLIYGDEIKARNLGTLHTYSDIAATVCDMLGVPYSLSGDSVLPALE